VGGLVVLMLSFSMLRAEQSKFKETKEERQEGIEKESPGITPLGIPLIAGPGAISTVIVNANTYKSSLIWIIGVAILVSIILWIILHSANFIEKILGRVGINIFTRIGGLILASNAVDTIYKALLEMFPRLR